MAKQSILKSMATVSGFTMLSRVLGFARQVLITGVIGASGSPVADAFWAAFRLPNMFRRLLAEGAFQAAFIPLFQGEQVEGGHDAAKRFAEDVLAWLIFILTGLSAIIMIFAPFFVNLIATGFTDDPEKYDLTVLYVRIMFPYLACMSLVGLLGGMLNAMHKFVASAAAPLALNISMIIAVLLYARADAETAGQAASWGVMAGGILQLFILLFGAWRSGFLLRLRLPKPGPGVKRLLMLGTPGFIGAGALQINSIIGTNIASREAGAVSWLMNADQLYQLPLAVIGIALGIVLMPSISRSIKEGNEKQAMFTLNRGLEIALIFALPAAAALVTMAALICGALFQDFAGDALRLVGVNKSAFNDKDVAATGLAVMIYGCGLPAFIMHKVLAASFFAREDTKTPMKTALMSITINATLSILLFPRIGFIAIAFATIVASWCEVTVLSIIQARRGVLRPDLKLMTRAPRIVLCAVGMGGVLWFGVRQQALLQDMLFGQSWLVLIALTIVGLVVYGLLVLITGAVNLSDLKRARK